MINFLQTVPIEPQPGFMQQYSFIIMIGLMVLVLWLFMWRPEAKRRKQMQEFRNGLKKGDKVITAGGIYGVVKERTGQNVWCYTGYTLEECLADPARRECLRWIDTLVDGRYVEALRDLSLDFRGSSNQRIIDVGALHLFG